jgi:hypothetical protein
VRFGDATGGTHIALADDGTLVYVPAAPISRERHLAWMDLQGRRTHLPGPSRRFRELRLDPRGERAAVRIGPPDQADVWIQDTTTGKLSQLTFGLRAWHPVWTPDGKYVTVGSQSGGRWRLLSVPLAGGAPRVLYEGPNRLYPGEWSSDGRFLAFQERHPVRDWDIAVLEVCGECEAPGQPRAVATTPALEARPRFSPDGRWLAYESDELDAVLGVYVVPFGRPGPRANASRPAGRWPVWGARGELFYWVPFPSEMRRVTFREEGGALQVRTDEAVWAPPGREGNRLPAPVYDFDSVTRRFLYLEAPRPDTPPPPYQPVLFVGWNEEVRRLTRPQ